MGRAQRERKAPEKFNAGPATGKRLDDAPAADPVTPVKQVAAVAAGAARSPAASPRAVKQAKVGARGEGLAAGRVHIVYPLLFFSGGLYGGIRWAALSGGGLGEGLGAGGAQPGRRPAALLPLPRGQGPSLALRQPLRPYYAAELHGRRVGRRLKTRRRGRTTRSGRRLPGWSWRAALAPSSRSAARNPSRGVRGRGALPRRGVLVWKDWAGVE